MSTALGPYSRTNNFVFDPSQVSGLALWLDAADSSTVTGTTSVTQWRDKSGNGRNTTTTGTISYANSGISITKHPNGLCILVKRLCFPCCRKRMRPFFV